jgi:hypothetical protein
VPATILIAIGGFLAAAATRSTASGRPNYFELGKFLAVLFLLAGFLVSIEAFREIRVPFTSIVLSRRSREPIPTDADGAFTTSAAPAATPAPTRQAAARRPAIRPTPPEMPRPTLTG